MQSLVVELKATCGPQFIIDLNDKEREAEVNSILHMAYMKGRKTDFMVTKINK